MAELSKWKRADRAVGDTFKPRDESRCLLLAYLPIESEFAVVQNPEPPNLLAEFGNGAGIIANQDILPEETLHQELGLKGRFSVVDFRLAYFEDDTENKIVFIPVSIGTEKAINVDESALKGWEASVGIQGTHWRYQVMMTQLLAYFQNSFARYKLPQTPTQVISSEISLHYGDYQAYLLNRFEGRVYRDLANDQKIPSHWISDLGMSAKLKLNRRFRA